MVGSRSQAAGVNVVLAHRLLPSVEAAMTSRGWSVARRLALAAILTALISALPLVAEASAASAAAGPVFPGMNASESPLVPCRHDVQRGLVGGRTGCLPFGVGPLVVHP